MRLSDIDSLGFGFVAAPAPPTTIDLKKVLCMCHSKWVWVHPTTDLPYWCTIKELHAPLAE